METSMLQKATSATFKVLMYSLNNVPSDHSALLDIYKEVTARISSLPIDKDFADVTKRISGLTNCLNDLFHSSVEGLLKVGKFESSYHVALEIDEVGAKDQALRKIVEACLACAEASFCPRPQEQLCMQIVNKSFEGVFQKEIRQAILSSMAEFMIKRALGKGELQKALGLMEMHARKSKKQTHHILEVIKRAIAQDQHETALAAVVWCDPESISAYNVLAQLPQKSVSVAFSNWCVGKTTRPPKSAWEGSHMRDALVLSLILPDDFPLCFPSDSTMKSSKECRQILIADLCSSYKNKLFHNIIYYLAAQEFTTILNDIMRQSIEFLISQRRFEKAGNLLMDTFDRIENCLFYVEQVVDCSITDCAYEVALHIITHFPNINRRTERIRQIPREVIRHAFVKWKCKECLPEALMLTHILSDSFPLIMFAQKGSLSSCMKWYTAQECRTFLISSCYQVDEKDLKETIEYIEKHISHEIAQSINSQMHAIAKKAIYDSQMPGIAGQGTRTDDATNELDRAIKHFKNFSLYSGSRFEKIFCLCVERMARGLGLSTPTERKIHLLDIQSSIDALPLDQMEEVADEVSVLFKMVLDYQGTVPIVLQARAIAAKICLIVNYDHEVMGEALAKGEGDRKIALS